MARAILDNLTIDRIHNSLVNGQRKQMVKQIKEYGLHDFWQDYSNYLEDIYTDIDSVYTYLKDAVISYHRITNN